MSTTDRGSAHLLWLAPAVLIWRLCAEIYIRLGRLYGR